MVATEQMSLVTDEYDPLAPLRLLGCQQLGGLGHQFGALEARGASEGADDLGVDPPYARSRLGKVDQGMPACVEGCRGGPHRHGLAGADRCHCRLPTFWRTCQNALLSPGRTTPCAALISPSMGGNTSTGRSISSSP